MESDNNKSRYNIFIKGLLNNPSATKNDKDRIVDLLLKERDKGYVTEEQVRKMIEEYGGVEKDKKNEVSKNYLHNPKNMVNFLYNFSVDKDFKWFTHDPDINDFNYDVYLKKAASRYKKMSKGINSSTWNNVKNFILITDNDACDSYNGKIEFRWKDLRDWCFENKFKHPFEALMGDYKFDRYIKIFKNTIEFRTDNSDLLFSHRVEDFMYDEAVSCDDIRLEFTDSFYNIGESLRAYIDVRQLFAALREIGKWVICNKSKSSQLMISLEETTDGYILEIFHKNSNMNIDNEKMKGLSGDFHKVRNILLNVADLIIEADVNQTTKRIVCLDEKTEYNKNVVVSDNKIEELNDKVGGVKYLIKMYKNIQ